MFKKILMVIFVVVILMFYLCLLYSGIKGGFLFSLLFGIVMAFLNFLVCLGLGILRFFEPRGKKSNVDKFLWFSGWMLVIGVVFCCLFFWGSANIDRQRQLNLLDSFKAEIRGIQETCQKDSRCPDALVGWKPSNFAELEKPVTNYRGGRDSVILYKRSADKKEFTVKFGLGPDESYEAYGGVGRELKFYLQNSLNYHEQKI